MPAFKVRRLLKATGGIRPGGGTNYADFDTTGFLTLNGTARVNKDLWIPAQAFTVSGCAAQGHEGPWFIPGSSTAASYAMSLGGGTFTALSAGSAQVVALQSVCAITASMWYAQAMFPVPKDRATTGSLLVRVVWTTASDHSTAGSAATFKAALGYMAPDGSMRTSASTGACPTYEASTASILQENTVGSLASWGSTDTMGILTIGHDPSDGDDELGASNIRIFGVKIRYVSDRLGTQTS